MGELTVCTSTGDFRQRIDARQVRQILSSDNGTHWLDMTDPSDEDMGLLRDEFRFHPLALEDVVRRHQRPKVDSYGSYYFVVFYCLGMDENGDRPESEPLYLFIGKNYLVTVHQQPISQVAETLRRWQAPDSPLGDDVAGLIYALLDALVDDYFPVMDRIGDRVDELEQAIFETFDEGSLQMIFQLKKDLLALRRIVAPERDVLNVMLRRDIPVFDQNDITYLQDVYDHIVRITDVLDSYRELLSSALDSFLSVQSNRLNQIVKVLTVTSIVLMSASLVAGIYGMNFAYMPELGWRFGYAWALGLMIAIAGGLILFFKRVKWL